MKLHQTSTFASIAIILGLSEGFVPSHTGNSHRNNLVISSTATPVQQGEDTATHSNSLLSRDRYIATNRFAVRANAGPKFEKRWCDRKSRLAELEGFKYFHLMRRVTLDGEGGTCVYDEGADGESAFGNYVSFTIWEKKSDFGAWLNGDAFKEAHGGNTIGAFLSTMIQSAMVLRGAPKPAFYDGLLLQSSEPEVDDSRAIVNGWRTMESSGEEVLPAECFVACNQFFVPSENAIQFEQRWANRESKLKECDGFVAFSMMRRDGKAKGHGTSPVAENEPTYLSTTLWRDRAAFDAWRSGNAFKQAHGSNQKTEGDAEEKKAAPLWSRPPEPIFYEGTLVITSEDGA